jgi:hypothetical protein
MQSRINTALVLVMVLALALALPRAVRAAELPSLDLEGTGNLSAANPSPMGPSCPCATASCGGSFTATLSGMPFTKATLDLTLSTTLLPVPGKGGCATATGTGTLKANPGVLSVQFYGQVCSDPLCQWFSLSGTVQMVVSPQTPGQGDAASGTLVAGGPIHIPCPTTTKSPFPFETTEMLVSILGVSGKLPLLVP